MRPSVTVRCGTAPRTTPGPYNRTGGPRGTARVRRETVSKFETEVHSLPLDETEVQGCF